MPSYDVTIATCDPLPEPDPDQAPLLEALARAGLQARVRAWDDETVDWSDSRLTLIRSTWDYYHDRPAFVAWAAHVDEVSTLHNPPDVVRWNTHKGYLLELADKGVPVVPTELVEQGSARSLTAICDERGWQDVVVKPAVSAGSFETHPMRAHELDEPTFRRLVDTRDVMVQPYVESVDAVGERSVITIDGQITHSIRKNPRFAGEDESVTGPHPVDGARRRLVDATLDAVGSPLLYARVDIVADASGAPMLAELELVEPSLFFRFGARALERYVDGVTDRLGLARGGAG